MPQPGRALSTHSFLGWIDGGMTTSGKGQDLRMIRRALAKELQAAARRMEERRLRFLREALRLGVEVAEGLSAAHHARVKILDFGLAKLLEELQEPAPGEASKKEAPRPSQVNVEAPAELERIMSAPTAPPSSGTKRDPAGDALDDGPHLVIFRAYP